MQRKKKLMQDYDTVCAFINRILIKLSDYTLLCVYIYVIFILKKQQNFYWSRVAMLSFYIPGEVQWTPKQK
jgi:ABC-type protease/lipase transport system fused ATPase/permease subunit